MNYFDKLTKDAQKTTPEEGWAKVWKAFFSLERILIAVSRQEDKAEQIDLQIFIGSMDEKPCIFAFTDQEQFTFFQRKAKEEKDERTLNAYEFTMTDFLTFTQEMNNQGVSQLMINFGGEAFYLPINEVIPTYEAFMKPSVVVTEKVFEANTPISVRVPDNMEGYRSIFEQIKGTYSGEIRMVSLMIFKIKEDVSLGLVIQFKEGYPSKFKGQVVEQLHHELSQYEPFQQQLFISEDISLIPPALKDDVEIVF